MNSCLDDKDLGPRKYNGLVPVLSELSHKWFPNGDGKIDLSIYPCVGIEQIQIMELLNGIFSPTQEVSDTRFCVAVVYMDSIPILNTHTKLMPHSENPAIWTTSEVISDSSASGPGLMLATAIEDKSVKDLHRHHSLPIIAILRMHFGISIAWETPYTMRFNPAKQDLWHTLTIGRHYNPNTDGPFKRDSFKNEIISILNIIQSKNRPPYIDRACLALELLCEAGSYSSSLTRANVVNYWTAIERLCDTNSTGELIKIIYKKSKDDHPVSKSLFKKIRVLRHNIVHKGHSNQTSVDLLERYLNLVFLDALNFIFELPPQYYLEQFIEKHGVEWLNEVYQR